ncbi:hypothetical protein [Plastoroseomonas hellenica]|uniref:hypothetical protein n=1 Tax=Plastoroseomonas hellenica TaxID=2687306 RepID=UPI001BA9DE25|nr:hypothetical protein [Plastoroseomonas hellenica]MBR0647711.1 hypothetical protein [Plastoroseomonas hellenica]
MASDITTTPDTPQGTDVETAASSIAELLARDSGEPGAAAAPRMSQAKADPAEAQHPGPDGETPIDAEGPELEPEVEIEPEDPPAEADEDTTEPDPAKTLVTVEIDGKAQRLPLAEVTRGYLRQADYTRKTQALAEDRRAFDGEASAVRQERLQYAQLLPALAFQVQQMQGPEPDWARLKEEDPVGYMLKREATSTSHSAAMTRSAAPTMARCSFSMGATEPRTPAATCSRSMFPPSPRTST